MFKEKEIQPIRTALVTSRNAPAHERAVKTLRNWGVSINEAFFLGGVSKTEVLAAFGAHIFFDDQDIHTEPASAVVPAATVPYRNGDNPKEQTALYYSKMVGRKQCRLIHMYQKGNLN